MFIRKSQYKRAKDFWFGYHPRPYYLSKAGRSTPLTLRISADRYRELALSNPDKTAEHIITSIRMLKGAMVCERLLKSKRV